MDITFEEGKFLALYQEFYNEEYNADDERESETEKGVMLRHEKMQTLGYLLNCMGISLHGYSQLKGSAHSYEIETLANNVDSKKESLPAFYESYNRNRNSSSDDYISELESVLFYYFKTADIQKIGEAKLAFGSFFQTEEGRALLDRLLYLAQRSCYSSVDTLLIELNAKGFYPSPDLVESVWVAFAQFGIRETVDKIQERKRLLSLPTDR